LRQKPRQNDEIRRLAASAVERKGSFFSRSV
jgi:hypothetical protein